MLDKHQAPKEVRDVCDAILSRFTVMSTGWSTERDGLLSRQKQDKADLEEARLLLSNAQATIAQFHSEQITSGTLSVSVIEAPSANAS